MVDHTGFLTIADEAVAHLKRIKQEFPRLVSPHVISALENWNRLERDGGSVEWTANANQESGQQALEMTAIVLIGKHQVEDVMALLNEEFDVDLDYTGLINLVGEERYRVALRNEAIEMKLNQVSYEQMADLWNAMGKPALGDERWTKQSISALSD